MSGVITYQMVVDQSGAVKSIEQVEQTLRSSEAAFDNQTRAINRNTKALGEQERTANLAGMAALELSRVASDAAYGIRGMANNIGQLVTIFAMMSAQTNVATGAVLGLGGAIRATWAAIKGPMGIVFAIQGLLTLLTLWESKTSRQKKAQEELNRELEVTSNHISSGQLKEQLEALVDVVAEGGVAGKQAEIELADLINNYERLSLTMTDEEILKKKIRHLELLEDEKRLAEIIEESYRKSNFLKDKENEMYSDGKSTLEDIDKIRTQGLQFYHNAKRAEDILLQKKRERLKLEELFRKTEKQGNRELLDGFEYLDLLSGLDFKGNFFDAKGWVDAYFGEFSGEKLKSINDQLRDAAQLLQKLGYINAKPMFGNDSLEGIRVFSHHLDAISGTMFAMGNTFSNVADIIDDGSDRMEERLKILYDLQQGFAVASITIDTLVALAKVNAQTGVLGTLLSAQIIAQGVAGVTAVLAQKPGRSSQLKGVKNSSIGTAQDDTVPVTTTGFSNLAGGEKPNQDIRVYVMGSDIRSVQDRSTRTKVRAKL